MVKLLIPKNYMTNFNSKPKTSKVLNGILPNKKLNHWQVFDEGKLVKTDKSFSNCVWTLNYVKLK